MAARYLETAQLARLQKQSCDPLQSTVWMWSLFTEATVLGVVEDDSQGSAIILDRTIFHPQGGGQPSDEGTWCAALVMDVSVPCGNFLLLWWGSQCFKGLWKAVINH